jgi:MYXO-CTERM domain-containing protein
MMKHAVAIAALLACAQTASASIDIQFDYSYDATGFFASHAGSMAVLDGVAGVFESRFADTFTAIDSGGVNDFTTVFFNPADPFGADVSLAGQDIGADVIRVYVGGYDFADGTLGLGGPGGYSCSGTFSFCSNAADRGQSPAPADVAMWGGAISFDSTASWHFGASTSGLDSSLYDFYSVAVHELAHVLGFATSEAFNAHVDANGFFAGDATGAVALTSDASHWAYGTLSTYNGQPQEAAMDPDIAGGVRKHFTDLDFAAMQDIGWQVTPVPEAGTWAMMLAGLGLVGGMARRRSRMS